MGNRFIQFLIERVCYAIFTLVAICNRLTLLSQPVFLKETEDCTYMFEWHTPFACPPYKSIDCSYK